MQRDIVIRKIIYKRSSNSLTRKIFLISLIALSFCSSLIVTPEVKAEEKIVRFTTGEWPPYISKTIDGYGIIPHIISEAFKLEGYRVEYDFFPWTRSYQLAQTGIWHGSVTWQPTPERTRDFLFSDPVIQDSNVFYHLNDLLFEGNRLEELRYFRIGTTRSYSYAPGLRENLAEIGATVIDSDDDLTNFKLLLDRRIDLVLMDINVGNYLLHKYFQDEQSFFATSSFLQLQQAPQCIIFPKNSPSSRHLQTAFNKGLKKLKENGRYDQILSQLKKTSHVK